MRVHVHVRVHGDRRAPRLENEALLLIMNLLWFTQTVRGRAVDAILAFFSGEQFMPHGHCFLWKPALVWIQLRSNLAIGLTYVAIAITLVYLVRRIEDMPFKLV